MHHPQILATLAELRITELPAVRSPVGRDPFLDGLDDAAPPTRDRPGRPSRLEQRARVLASLIARPDDPQSGRSR